MKMSLFYSLKYPLLFISFAILILIGCKEKNAVDVSMFRKKIEIIRWDLELAKAKSNAEILNLINTNKAFASLYTNQVLGIEAKNQDSLATALMGFIKDTSIIKLNALVENKYSNIKDIQSDIEEFYAHLKYYFPKFRNHPKLYTYISNFGYQMFIFQDDEGHDALAIGLDMFLYPEINYKNVDPDNTNFSQYVTRSWNRDHIVKKLGENQLTEILGEPGGFKLLDLMIHNGKQLYMLSKLLPSLQDTIIHEYSLAQMEWCKKNESQMWSYFLDQKLFYESMPSKINKYVNPSPFSPNMPTEAPGRTANYIGYRIVEAYMNRFPKTTFDELTNMKNSQAFLEKSKFKPNR
jgi:hypothetical protein